METADLHFHSTYSDGKHSVSWVVEQLRLAKASGLRLAVLTDHDGIQGYQEFRDAMGQDSICASELSCTYDDSESGKSIELHLLVYGLDPQDSELHQRLNRFKEERRLRFFRICERLTQAGYKLDAESFSKRHPGVLGRPHVADLLVESGVVRTRNEAFERFLKDSHPYMVKKWRFPLNEAVAFARQKGCRTSIAHPGQYGFQEPLLRKFRDLGVDAIEIYHPRHDEIQIRQYLEIAKQLGFQVTGGSDFHSDETDLVANQRPSVGRTQYPYELAQKFLKGIV